MGAVIVVAITFVLMWVLFILPQQRRVRAHQALVERLEVGDEVMTSTGLYGTITGIDDDIVFLEIAAGTVVRVARGAIAQREVELEAVADAGDDTQTAAGADDPVDVDAADNS